MQTVTAGAGQKKACGGGTFALCDTLLCKAGPNERLYRWPQIRDLLNRYCGYELADDDLLLLSIGGTLYFIADIGLRMLSRENSTMRWGSRPITSSTAIIWATRTRRTNRSPAVATPFAHRWPRLLQGQTSRIRRQSGRHHHDNGRPADMVAV